MSTTTSTLLQPAFVGGLVMGVLTALPIVSAGNVCCCLWVISGGLVAAYVLQQRQPTPITQGDGALVGLLAGIIGAFVYLALSIPISLFMAPMERHFVQRLLERSSNMPPEFRDFLERFSAGDVRMTFAATAIRVIFGFAFWLVMGAIFSTLGGLLGAVLFSKPQQPQTIDVPPTRPAP